jgi:hypothetical protein
VLICTGQAAAPAADALSFRMHMVVIIIIIIIIMLPIKP